MFPAPSELATKVIICPSSPLASVKVVPEPLAINTTVPAYRGISCGDASPDNLTDLLPLCGLFGFVLLKIAIIHILSGLLF
jgi:hypothetical protein